jgi:glycosyltransferase involved in cell wall biosynthesis
MNIQRPTVSICCITYNHEQFLIQAIESVLMQRTDFEVEMVIGEDCSPDNTRAVALEYERRYPNCIRVLTPSVNLGIMPNLMATMAACRGEYIAMLEGDDFWTDPTKLQRQVDALRANPDCAFCFHDAEIIYETNPPQLPVVFSQHVAAHALPMPSNEVASLRFTQVDLARAGWIAPTASLLFRAVSLSLPLPAWYAGVFSGDYTLHLLSARWGPALYLPQIMSCYRLHKNSITVTSSQSEYQFERRIYEANMFQKYVFDPKYKKYADIYLSVQCLSYAQYLGSKGKRSKQFQYFTKYLYNYRQRIPLYITSRLQKVFKKMKIDSNP